MRTSRFCKRTQLNRQEHTQVEDRKERKQGRKQRGSRKKGKAGTKADGGGRQGEPAKSGKLSEVRREDGRGGERSAREGGEVNIWVNPNKKEGLGGKMNSGGVAAKGKAAGPGRGHARGRAESMEGADRRRSRRGVSGGDGQEAIVWTGILLILNPRDSSPSHLACSISLRGVASLFGRRATLFYTNSFEGAD